jgi:ELWxxDGT repeat protein
LAGTNAILRLAHGAGSRLFLFAETFEAGNWILRLYATEGTAATTHAIMKADLHGSIDLGEGFVIGDNFYFRHDDGIHGMELWRTDGTTAQLFADINPGYRSGIDFIVSEERPDGKVLFVATEFNTGREPWITDGTAGGTHLLANCAAESSVSGSSPHLLRASGERVFFDAQLTGGDAIGVSDGTSAGTAATLVDFPWTIQNAAAANGRYFFSIPTGLYVTDGTTAEPTRISEQPASPQALPNGVLFNRGLDLWFSDGTTAGTRKIHTFEAAGSSLRIVPAGNAAWILHGPRLWTTDGTEAGTVEVIPSPAATSEVYDLVRSGVFVYFLESSAFNHGIRLWRSDGTGAGTTIVKEITPGLGLTAFVGATDHFVYFNSNGKLYRSDGSGAGTFELPVSSPCLGSGAALADALVLTAFASNGTLTVWRSDGTAAGTTQLAAMQTRDPRTGCWTLTARGNAAYMSGWDAAHGWEPWVTDGSAAGTKMLADIYPGARSSFPGELTLAGDRLFFSADSPDIGRELWALGGHSAARHRAARP